MSTSNQLEPVLLQNDGSNFLSWSFHVLNVFRTRDINGEFPIGECFPIPVLMRKKLPRPRPRKMSQGRFSPHPHPRAWNNPHGVPCIHVSSY